MSHIAYDGYPELAERIEVARRSLAHAHVARHILLFVTLFAATVLLFSLIGSLGPLTPLLRWAMLLVLLALVLGGSVLLVFKPLFRDWTDEEVAAHLEARFPEIDNALINSVQLAKDPAVTQPEFVARVIRQAERDTRSVAVNQAADRRPAARLAASSGVLVLALMCYAVFYSDAFARAMHRILLPAAYVPAAGAARIIEVQPGSATVVAGDPLHIVVRYERTASGEIGGTVLYMPEGGPERPREMKPVGPDQFAFTLPDLRTPLAYRVNVGGTESERYAVGITERPAVVRIDVAYEFPAYTALPARREDDSNGDIKAPQGSTATLVLTANKAIRDGAICGTGFQPVKPTAGMAVPRDTGFQPVIHGQDGRATPIKSYSQDIPLQVDKANPRLLTARIPVAENGTYTIRVRDREGNESRSPVIHRIVALPDQSPAVRIISPGRDITAQPGETINIAFQATDDYGLASAELVTKSQNSAKTVTATGRASEASGIRQAHAALSLSKGGDAPLAVFARWDKFADPRNTRSTHTFRLDPQKCKPGDTIEYYVQATDSRALNGSPAGQTARSPAFLIKIEDRQKIAEDKIKNLKTWEERLRKVLDQEVALRADATALEKADAAALDTGSAALAAAQADARTETQRIAGEIQPTAPDLRRIKEVLYALAANDMADAVQHGEALKKPAPLPHRQTELAAFEKSADAVIATLRKLLDILPKLEEVAKKQADEQKGMDLSNDTQDKLKDLERGLKDFIEEQKKVIDATQDLAQKNVDDFTKEDDLKLNDLAAAEDKWSQFFTEKHTDLSKLPEQDLANSSLLKELTEVQSEVQMAKDALDKKAAEIATALEDNGLELAEALTTHIEKWLPDTPDRDQWKMEEAVGDINAPMAELPKELEDLVGDLMEEEEDLLEEVEDATSGYADSLDKGAGWDAMDGPISNMSAQGVTGNRLPNTSEIGGRSGEGRSGKSSGEFVEDSATGKGGRKTPTRLTPDAYEKGQVNDTSKDPSGGSTGGGKASGAGAGGLEGPVPPQVQAKLNGLAAKQAELRNKTEKIDAQFKVQNWPSPFEETVGQMKQVETDLRDGRYQNVLRRRPIILKNLKDTRTFLDEQVRINRDYASPLPHNLQDEILDSAEGAAPRGYEQLLKDYYKSLSQQDRSP